jgi:hypothetical protein
MSAEQPYTDVVWTAEMVQTLTHMWLDKKSAQLIAERLRIPVDSVKWKRKHLRLPNDPKIVKTDRSQFRGREPWTFADDQMLMEMWKSGATQKEIGKAIGRTEHSIDARRRMLQLPRRHQGYNTPWTDGEIVKLKRMWNSGISSKQIAYQLKKNTNAVKMKALRLGLGGQYQDDYGKMKRQINFMVTKEFFEQVSKRAFERNMTLANHIRSLIKRDLGQ